LRNPISGTQFQRDVKLAQKRGKDMAKLREAILLLIEGTPLPHRYKDHPLGGEWKHFRERMSWPDRIGVDPEVLAGKPLSEVPGSRWSSSATCLRRTLTNGLRAECLSLRESHPGCTGTR
jgi:mRNA interferase YafQ